VPFLLKDLNQDIEGVPTSAGCRALAGRPAQQTSTIVERWRDAGLVIFGKTTTPEFGSKGVTEADLFGPTRNPWDLDRTPGGSSGGAAAAVAARIIPVAVAPLGEPPIRIGALDTPAPLRAIAEGLLRTRTTWLARLTGAVDQMVQRSLGWVPCTQLANVIGRPAISLPLYGTPDGLPTGIQFVGRLQSEGLLLRLAANSSRRRRGTNAAPPARDDNNSATKSITPHHDQLRLIGKS